MSLTSHNSGTPADDEILGQAEQEVALSREEMDRADHQPGQPEERGQDEQQLSLGNDAEQAGHNHASQDNGRAEHCCNQAAHINKRCSGQEDNVRVP